MLCPKSMYLVYQRPLIQFFYKTIFSTELILYKGPFINYVDKQGGRGWSNANDTKLYLSMKESGVKIPQNPVNVV